jgi:hypothetical protein
VCQGPDHLCQGCNSCFDYTPSILLAWKANEVWRNTQSSSLGLADHPRRHRLSDHRHRLRHRRQGGEWVRLSGSRRSATATPTPHPLYADGRIYAPLMEGAVFVLDAKDGKQLQKDRPRRQLHRRCSPDLQRTLSIVHTTEKLVLLPDSRTTALTVDPNAGGRPCCQHRRTCRRPTDHPSRIRYRTQAARPPSESAPWTPRATWSAR